jgi:hypothetical protein
MRTEHRDRPSEGVRRLSVVVGGVFTLYPIYWAVMFGLRHGFDQLDAVQALTLLLAFYVAGGSLCVSLPEWCTASLSTDRAADRDWR